MNLKDKKLVEFIDLVAQEDISVASGCVLMAEVAMACGLIEMSFKISQKHNTLFEFDHLIKLCGEGRHIALGYLQEDSNSLKLYKKDKKKGVAALLRSSERQLALVQSLVRNFCALENEVYLPTKNDYLAGIRILETCHQSIQENLNW